ncbi:MAG: hypothetical protein WCJ64_07130, partial [Rhodospirillaceae bacterium]
MRNPLEVTCYNEIGLPRGKFATRLEELPKTPAIVHRLLKTNRSPNLPLDIIIGKLAKNARWHDYEIWNYCPERAPYAATVLLTFIRQNPFLHYDCDQRNGLGTWPDLPLELWHQLVDLNHINVIEDLVKNPATPAEVLRRLMTIKPALRREEIDAGATESWQERWYGDCRAEAAKALSRKDPTAPLPEITFSGCSDAYKVAENKAAHPAHLEKCIDYAFSLQETGAPHSKDGARVIGQALENPNISPEVRQKTCGRIISMFERYVDHGGGIAELKKLIDYIIYYERIVEQIGVRLLYRLFQLDLPKALDQLFSRFSTTPYGTAKEIEACWSTPPTPLFTGEPYDYDERGVELPPDYRNDHFLTGDARFSAMRTHDEIKHLLGIHPKAPPHIVAEAETSAPDDIKAIIAHSRYNYPGKKARGLIKSDGTEIKEPVTVGRIENEKVAFNDYVIDFRDGRIPLKLDGVQFNMLRRFVDAGCDISDLVTLIIERLMSEGRAEAVYYSYKMADILCLARFHPRVYELAATYALNGGRHAGDIRFLRFLPLSILQQDDPCFDGLTNDYILKFGLDEAVRRLATEGHLETRVVIARNIHAPPDVLDILAFGEAMILRKAVADNPNAGPKTLARLAVDPVPGVRRRARANPGMPKGVPEEEVSNGGGWEESWSDPYPDPALWGQALLSWLPENKGCLGELARSPHFVVRETALRNPMTPVERLIEAVADRDPAIRAAVAANPAAPLDVQRRLAGDTVWYVRWELARNEKAAAFVLLTLIETGDWKIWEVLPAVRTRASLARSSIV